MLHHVCDVACDENMCGPIRTRKCRRKNCSTICKVNSTTIYNFADRATNNYNAHIVQYLKKSRQSGDEISSVNRMEHEKYFSSKIM